MDTTTEYTLNIAASCVGTKVLGPGLRSVVWVQGCPFNCVGCISPQWIPIRKSRVISIETIAAELLSDPQVDGFTFSGCEPFLQAAALAILISHARKQRDLSLICYTGYRLGDLETQSAKPGIWDLLSQIDVLIDGPYEKALNDNHGLRGSSNQTIHHLTDRLRGFDFTSQPRSSEIYIRDGEMLFVGVPPLGMLSPVVHDVSQHNRKVKEIYERA